MGVGAAHPAFLGGQGRRAVLLTHTTVRANSDGDVLSRRSDIGVIDLNAATPAIGRFDTLLEIAGVPGLGTAQESMPKATPDGRYVAWIDPGPPQRIKVYDFQTQGLVNSGVPIGSGTVQSWALAQTDAPVIVSFQAPSVVTQTSPSTTLRTTLSQPLSVGILVQRIAGTRVLLGRRVSRLVDVGRVPLGKQKRGASRIPWNIRVGGKALPRGRYQITLRALRGSKVVELSTPRVVTVR